MEPTEADQAKANDICSACTDSSYGLMRMKDRIARALAAAREEAVTDVCVSCRWVNQALASRGVLDCTGDAPVVRKVLYLIYSREHNAWWGPNKAGYFVDIENAGRYTNDEADAIVKGCGPRGGYSGEGCHEFKMLAPESLAAAEAARTDQRTSRP